MRFFLIIFSCLWGLVALTPVAVMATTQSKDLVRFAPASTGFSVRVLVENLQHPWGIAWLPSSEMLITEREGFLRRVSPDFRQISKPITGLPNLLAVSGQGGLLDVAVHPEYSRNGWIYISYVERQDERSSMLGTALIRARLKNDRLIDVERLFSMQPKSRGGRHFGGRILLDGRGFVYLALGDRGDEDRAQIPRDHAGAVVRLHDDGRIPQDNPFIQQKEIPSEVFSRGHRNIQGLAFHPVTGELFAHEHGPQGGDELNRILPGRNYGWPLTTYGVNYITGSRIGEGTSKAGMEAPLHVWIPSIAPSGFAFYTGSVFPKWQGSVFLGGLKSQSLVRLEFKEGRVILEERLLVNTAGRIRDVRTGPDGLIYLLTDAPDGQLLRIEPQGTQAR